MGEDERVTTARTLRGWVNARLLDDESCMSQRKNNSLGITVVYSRY